MVSGACSSASARDCRNTRARRAILAVCCFNAAPPGGTERKRWFGSSKKSDRKVRQEAAHGQLGSFAQMQIRRDTFLEASVHAWKQACIMFDEDAAERPWRKAGASLRGARANRDYRNALSFKAARPRRRCSPSDFSRSTTRRKPRLSGGTPIAHPPAR